MVSSKSVHKDFLKICEFLEILTPPSLKLDENEVNAYYDSSCCPHCDASHFERTALNMAKCLDCGKIMEGDIQDEITLGINHIGADSRYKVRKKLVHEILHKKGIGHNARARRLGFYSSLPKDKLSEKVVDWIFNGGKRPPIFFR